MPTQLLLDGDDLPALMQRVRDELGPEAVVVKAERVRSGGVAGFFAKEHFEVTVEVPEPRPTGPQPTGRRARRLAEAGAPAGLQALLDAADASDGDEDGPDAPAASAPVSTQGDTFAALLASIDGMSGAVPAPRESEDGGGATDAAPAPRAARFVDKGVAVTSAAFGPFQPVADAATAAVVPAAGSAAIGSAAPAAPAAPALPAGRTELAAAASPEASASSATHATTGSATTPTPTAATGRPAVQPAMFTRLPAGTPTTRDAATVRAALAAANGTRVPAPVAAAPLADPAPADPAPADPAPATATSAAVPAPVAADSFAAATSPAALTAEPTAPVAAPTVDPRADDARRALAAVGIPATLLGDPAGDTLASLSGVLGRLPRTPSLLRAPGSLVAVIGEGSEVVAAAREIARRAGLDPQDVALAGDLRPTDATDREVLTPATAPRQRSRTSTLGAVTVVAVAVGPDRDDRRAAAALVGELDPDQCLAVVDARRKSADLRAWMGEVAGGRRFAGVAGTRVDETREPGTLLDLGVPVGWLDGQPATSVVWAAVLGEHLATV